MYIKDNRLIFKLSVQPFESFIDKKEDSLSTCIMYVQSILTPVFSHASRLRKYY